MEDLSCFVQTLEVSNDAQNNAKNNYFVIKSVRFPGHVNKDARIVKIGSIQTSIASPTTAPVNEQRDRIFRKVERMIEAAALEKVNILCLPEMWYMPYPFHSPDCVMWREFSEDAENGVSSVFLKKLASKFKIVIISSILESESELFFNSTLIISTDGTLIGKYRKIHIPPIEESFLQAGNFKHQIFETEFGKIGVVICYERHFPLCWLMHGLEQADIVINPSSEDISSFLSERLWFSEGVNAAVSNGYFTVLVNRNGIEQFSNGSSFCYFGSSYVASPEGIVTPHLPRDSDGLLITEVDLAVCQKVKQEFSIHHKHHLSSYIKELSNSALNQL